MWFSLPEITIHQAKVTKINKVSLPENKWLVHKKTNGSFNRKLANENLISSLQKTNCKFTRKRYLTKFTIVSLPGVYISFETHIFAPPPFFRIIFFPLTHGLKTGVFDRFLMPAQTSKKFAAAGGCRGAEPPLQRKFLDFSSIMECFGALKRSTSRSRPP